MPIRFLKWFDHYLFVFLLNGNLLCPGIVVFVLGFRNNSWGCSIAVFPFQKVFRDTYQQLFEFSLENLYILVFAFAFEISRIHFENLGNLIYWSCYLSFNIQLVFVRLNHGCFLVLLLFSFESFVMSKVAPSCFLFSTWSCQYFLSRDQNFEFFVLTRGFVIIFVLELRVCPREDILKFWFKILYWYLALLPSVCTWYGIRT